MLWSQHNTSAKGSGQVESKRDKARPQRGGGLVEVQRWLERWLVVGCAALAASLIGT